MKTIFISILIVCLCVLAICVKILLVKNGEFSGTCASNNPLINKNGEKCSYCGADPGDQCKKEENLEEK